MVVSYSQEKEFNMYDGVVWGPARTAKKVEFAATTIKQDQIEDAIFYVHLSSEVGQIPGTDTFTNEKDIVEAWTSLGMKHVKITKTKWGDYPVLAATGERPDGSTFYVAWVGINVESWALIIDYRYPKKKGHPSDDEKKIWETFLTKTKPKDGKE